MAGTQQVDSQTLRDTGVVFTNSAGTVGEIVSSVEGSIGSLIWTGGIADTFRADFESQYKPMLQQLATDMEAVRGALDQKAADYDLVFHGSV